MAATLFRGEVSLGFDLGRLADWSGSDFASLSRDPLSSSQFVLDAALFAPAGAVWTWLTRRAGWTLGVLVLGSFVIESIQAVTGAGGNDLIDVVANSLGALIGVGSALLVVSVVGAQLHSMSRTKSLQLSGVGVAVAVLVAVGWFVGASRRQENVRAIVVERFEDTDLESVQRQLVSDSERIWGAVPGVRADYFTDDTITVLRFPATFFGLHRCVYATWHTDDVEVQKALGDDCTRFLDF